MNSNFTYLRNVICIIALTFSFSTAFSQTNNKANGDISNLKASVVNNNLVLNWNTTDIIAAGYCEVQGSKDGKHFTTIGLVLGADPSKNDNSFAFKQNLHKMKPGLVYYRVVAISNQAELISEIVKKDI